MVPPIQESHYQGNKPNPPVASISVLSDEIHNSEGDHKGLSDKEIWFDKVLPCMALAFESLVEIFSTK